MSILHSTNSGNKAVKIQLSDLYHRGYMSYRYFTDIYTYMYKNNPLHELQYGTINGKLGFYTQIWTNGPKTKIETVFQLDMLEKYWDANTSEDMNYYAHLIDTEYKC